MGTKHPNPRRAKIHRNYSVEELAGLFRLHKNTVRSWLGDGLTPIDDQRPTLIRGDEVRRFLIERRAKAKRKCAPGRIYCLPCRAPKVPAGKMADLRSDGGNNGSLCGICPDCNRLIYRRLNPARLDAVRGDLDISITRAATRAVNASTLGMAVAGLAVALFSRRLNRRAGILVALGLLAIPTALLASAPDLTTFTILRIAQGLCMASAFTLTLAYLGEECSAMAAGGAFAAYITGNVASNLIGRLISAGVADHFGLAANFYLFSALNLGGAILVYFTLRSTKPNISSAASSPIAAWNEHLRNPPLRAAFGIGFCILFVFIGTFTYVNFVLVREPHSLAPMTLGLIYFVFLPAVITTPFAGTAVQRFGTQPTFWISLAVAGLGLPLLLLPNLIGIIAGLMLIGVGTFFAQAAATGFVGRAATTDRGSASGIYLASYFLGGLVGSAVLGQLFDRLGWEACVGGIALVLVIASALAFHLKLGR